jgi:Mycothiol maleylpyruvate isomerase N-terminal domain
MNEPATPAAADALVAVYGNITAVAGSLGEAALMTATRCAGWVAGDLLYHQLLDARRALRTFASPADGPADVDDVTYWRSYSPRSTEHEALGSAEAAAHARHVRIVAAAYPPDGLAWEWRETSGAACRAARACPHEFVTTQGHVLRTADFIATLAVEAAVHYIDLTVQLPAAPAADPASLGLVRRVLDGLLGTVVPTGWTDRDYVLKGTGRVPLDDGDRVALAALADQFPLFG